MTRVVIRNIPRALAVTNLSIVIGKYIFEYGDEHSGSKNAGNFLTSCRTSQLLKKDCAPWSK